MCKWLKSGIVYTDVAYHDDIRAVEKAIEIVHKFNCEHIIDKKVYVNRAAVWEYEQGTRYAGQKHLIEPFIEGFQKFNSNAGWYNDETPWHEVMQALSHFSYHITGGSALLCDVQGGIFHDCVVLTDPVINSCARSYGPTDLGPEGISSFFPQYRLNNYSRSHWARPRQATPYHRPTRGTTLQGRDSPMACWVCCTPEKLKNPAQPDFPDRGLG